MSRVTLMDGSIGQELVKRAGDRPTPLWSTTVMMEKPDLVAGLHRDYFAAGATVATANTYAVLRDPRRRKLYDRQLEGGARRLALVEGGAQADRQVSDERQGRTPNGKRYITLAHQDLAREDWKGAQRNLQMALTYERDNAWVQEKLAELKKKLR